MCGTIGKLLHSLSQILKKTAFTLKEDAVCVNKITFLIIDS